MAVTREKKEQIVADLTDKFKKVKLAVITDFTGLKSEEEDELRTSAEKVGVDYKVYKNTLIKLALKNAGIDADDSVFTGTRALAFGYEDEVAPSKVVFEFTKSHENVKILGGILDGKLVEAETINTLALIPGRDELYARVVGSVSAPISGFVNVLSGNLRGLVSVLNQYHKQVS